MLLKVDTSVLFNESALIDSKTILLKNKSLILEILLLTSYSHYDTVQVLNFLLFNHKNLM